MTPESERAFLSDLWYFAMPGGDLRVGKTTPKKIAGQPILIGRGSDGQPFALRDNCPHRGVPLSYGHFDGVEVKCCYHGWRFGTDGVCTGIPSLTESDRVKVSRIRVLRYPCREVQGNIWIYLGRENGPLPEVPRIDDVTARHARITQRMLFPCHADHAVIGLVDPAHGPYVHESWWWRSGRSSYEKTKTFVPSELGFTMVRHPPSRNSRAYALLGGRPETEIRFVLPGIRIEHVRAGRHVFAGMTTVTPIDDERSEVHHIIYWTMPWLTMLKPLLRPFARRFLDQDRRIFTKQQKGLAYDPPLMLINDADVQAKWFYQLKQAHATARETGSPFENPLSERTLRWRT